MAEKKRPKTFPFLSQGEVPDSAQVRGGRWNKLTKSEKKKYSFSSEQVGTEYAFREEWGEQVHFSLSFCLDFAQHFPLSFCSTLFSLAAGWEK